MSDARSTARRVVLGLPAFGQLCRLWVSATEFLFVMPADSIGISGLASRNGCQRLILCAANQKPQDEHRFSQRERDTREPTHDIGVVGQEQRGEAICQVSETGDDQQDAQNAGKEA